jgi:small-conductance mechanosensitive channel
MTARSPGRLFNVLGATLIVAYVGSVGSSTVVAATGDNAAAPPQPEVAPVIIDGRTLIAVRGISALPAPRRAQDIVARIEAVARDDAIAVSSVHAVELSDRTNIMAGDRFLMSVADPDAIQENVGARQLLGELYVAKIAHAIEQYREERTAAYLLQQALKAALALGIVAALVALTSWVFRRLDSIVERRFATQMEALEARSFNLLTVEQLRGTIAGMLRALRWMLIFVVAFVGLEYTLGLFPWTRLIADRTAEIVIDPVRTMGDALLHAIPGLVFIAILIVVARYVLRLVALFFGGIASRRIRFKDFAQEWAWPTYRLVRIVIVAFTIVIAYPYIPGSNSDAFKGVSIFLGLLMSLGAASVVANSLAGYTLIYRRAFQVGDRIQVAGLVGDVVEMRQQVTHLRTVKNEEVTIPSSMMLNSHVVNYSSLARTEGLVLHTTVGIGYETPWRQVEAMLQLAASRTPGLKPEPVPFVLVKSLGDFAVVYELNAYCGDARTIDATYASMHRNILDVFNEYDVAIMTPAYVSDPAEPKVVPRDRWFLPPAKTPT